MTAVMTWKSTALVSGVTLLAGWLAAERPKTTTTSVAPAATTLSPQTAAATSDIVRQAARLQTRTRQEPEFHEPERNLFRFRATAPARSTAIAPAPSAEPLPVAVAIPAPVLPRISLSGIATDPDGERTVRTAVLSTPQGVLLVHEGDDVLGQYRVVTIGDDAVELLRRSDNTPLRLILKP